LHVYATPNPKDYSREIDDYGIAQEARFSDKIRPRSPTKPRILGLSKRGSTKTLSTGKPHDSTSGSTRSKPKSLRAVCLSQTGLRFVPAANHRSKRVTSFTSKFASRARAEKSKLEERIRRGNNSALAAILASSSLRLPPLLDRLADVVSSRAL
jgi:hypothetical protein